MVKFRTPVRLKFILFLWIGCLSFQSSFSQISKEYRWWNPARNSFPVIEGQGWHSELAHPYDRLPAKAEKTVRKAVWNLSQQSAGLLIRFRSNAGDIKVRYVVENQLAMPHMPATGVSGVDLYAVNRDGKWEWCGGKYHFADTIVYDFKSLRHDYVREYHLYLPLHNKVKWLEIGVREASGDDLVMNPLPVSPGQPLVVYGTSIAQGTGASRPGMAWTAILGRRLHRPVINLGFAGNGRLEKEVTDLLIELDPKLYLLDCLPNMTGFPDDTISARLRATVMTLREKHPQTPILIAAHADANIASLNKARDENYARVNKVAQAVFTKLKASGVERIYFMPAKKFGLDIESTIEGVHPNDYGMGLYAKAYEQEIRSILHEPTGKYTTTQPRRQYRDRTYDWETRHRKELEMNKTHPPEIIFLGNSITHYWGGLPKAPISRGEDSWEQYLAPHGVRNMGYGWDMIENVLWRVYHGALAGYQAKQIVMMIGTNNIGFNTDKEILAGLQFLLNQIRKRQPQAKILLLGIFPRSGQEQRIAVLNQQIVRLTGAENINYADPGTGLLKYAGKINDSLFVADGVHPNAAGYRILGKALEPYLIQESHERVVK